MNWLSGRKKATTRKASGRTAATRVDLAGLGGISALKRLGRNLTLARQFAVAGEAEFRAPERCIPKIAPAQLNP